MRIIATAAVWVVVSAALASAQGGSVSGFDRPLGRGSFGGRGGGLAACRQEESRGPCASPDAADVFVVPSAIWGEAIEGSGCGDASRAAFMAKLESAAAVFNGGVLWTRKAVGLQMTAQEGFSCPRAVEEWGRYTGKQRMNFYSRWQDEVRAWIAKCPPPSKEAAKPKRRAPRREAMCRNTLDRERVAGGCGSTPRFAPPPEDVDETMTHAGVQSCPERVRTQTHVIAGARLANFIMAEEFEVIAARHFLEGQAGVRCDETVKAHLDDLEVMSGTFHAAWLDKTAALAASCRSSSGD